MVLNDIRHILNILYIYKFNIFFYLYVYYTLYLWKKIILLNLLFIILAWLKIIYLWYNNKIFLLDKNIVDITIYKLLNMSKIKINMQNIILLTVEFILRYGILLVCSASSKTLSYQFDFFHKLYVWSPGYTHNKMYKFDKFIIYFIKTKYDLTLPYEKIIIHPIFGKLVIKKK